MHANPNYAYVQEWEDAGRGTTIVLSATARESWKLERVVWSEHICLHICDSQQLFSLPCQLIIIELAYRRASNNTNLEPFVSVAVFSSLFTRFSLSLLSWLNFLPQIRHVFASRNIISLPFSWLAIEYSSDSHCQCLRKAHKQITRLLSIERMRLPLSTVARPVALCL